MGQKQKTEKKKKERKKERLNNAWRTQARMAHASRLGQNESENENESEEFGG